MGESKQAKHIISISLGSSKRDASAVLELAGQKVHIERRGTDGDFKFSEEEREENVNIGISVRKGNTVLKEAIDSYLDTLTVDDFNTIMDEAIKVQPLGE